MSRTTLDRIFEPESIAVIGASADPAKRGHQIVRELLGAGLHIHPVNPRGGELLGLPVASTVEDLPDDVDLAVLCTPSRAAPEIVRQCGARGVAGAVVLAVGFGEAGDDGRALEAELVAAGRESGVRVIGPNTSGLMNLHAGVNLVGARGVRAGGLGVLVQSGNMALALMTEVTERSWDGISVYLGVGNEVDLGFVDALEYLAGHEETHAVVVYAEGFREAGAFLEVASRVSRSKPVVLLKGGRTRSGAQAALSHTGALAGPYDRLSAALAQAGIVELRRTDELLHVAEALGRQPASEPDRGIALLSDGGGQGTLAVDTLVEAGARLAALSGETRTGLRELLGPAAAVANPVDLAGAADGDPEVFGRAMELIVEDPAVGTVLLVGLFGGYGIRFADSLAEGERRAAVAMAEAARSAGRGLVAHTMYALHRSPPLEALGQRGVPVVVSLDVACRCVLELQRRGDRSGQEPWGYVPPAPAHEAGSMGEGEGRSALAHPSSRSAETEVEGDFAPDEARSVLTEPEARAVLTDTGLDFGPSALAGSGDEVVAALDALGRPVAVKLVSADVSHKSDAGGVVLDVATDEDARSAYERIDAGAREHARRHGWEPSDPVRVLVTPMLDPPRAELLVGAHRDPELGPVIAVGAGGVWVEALDDVALRVLPVTGADVQDMLGELRIVRTFTDGRGRAAVDPEPVVAAALAVAEAIRTDPRMVEVEINPLFVYDDRAVPVDARIVLEQAPEGET